MKLSTTCHLHKEVEREGEREGERGRERYSEEETPLALCREVCLKNSVEEVGHLHLADVRVLRRAVRDVQVLSGPGRLLHSE